MSVGFDEHLVVTSPGLVIHAWQGGAWRSAALGLDVQVPPRVQPVAHGGWLVQAGHRSEELHVVDARGSVARTFRIGWRAAAIQATAARRAWVGYNEQAILATDVGSAALAAFEPDGVGVFDLARVAPVAGLPVPLNVKAVNVASEQETWPFGTGEYSLVMALRHCLPRWMWRLAKSSGSCIADTAPLSSARFWIASTRKCQPTWTCISSWTTHPRRRRLHGVIRRAPRTLRYTLTANGLRAAFLYATLYRRLRQPRASAGAHPHFSSRIDAALHQLDTALQKLWSSAKHAA